MKKSIKTIGIIAAMAFIAVGSFYLGTTKAETITEIVVPDGYMDTTSKEFYDNFIDMRKVADYAATESGFMIYLDNGSGYYWER